MKPDQLQLGFLKVLKGSLMQKEAEVYGIVYKEKEPYEVLSTNWLTYGEVLKLKMVESMVEVYYNSGQFWHTLEYLVPFEKDAFTFYEKLGSFYEKKVTVRSRIPGCGVMRYFWNICKKKQMFRQK